MILTDVIAGTREIFLLRAARAKVESYGSTRHAEIRDHKRIAAARLADSRHVASPFGALELLAISLEHALAATQLAGQDPTVPPRPTQPPHGFGEAEALRDELELRITRLLADVESRTATELAGVRVGRLAAAAIVLLLCARSLVTHYGVRDVALGKPVLVSSVGQSRDPSGVVDGRTRGTFGVHTNEAPHPFVLVDLQRTYRIRKIRVYNRGDGWFDEVLPLSIELSTDGVTFHEIARRTTHFDVWDVDAGLAGARYVRASKDSGYIALNEIEVYSRD